MGIILCKFLMNKDQDKYNGFKNSLAGSNYSYSFNFSAILLEKIGRWKIFICNQKTFIIEFNCYEM